MNQMVALQTPAPELPTGTRLLNGQYVILDQLQRGGFGITYVARDSLERHVVIKECFPAGLCERTNGLVHACSELDQERFAALKQQFVREARGVATLKHPYIVAVHQVFEENNTAYMALDYVEGIDLITVLEDNPERITSAFVETTLRQALKAIFHIHTNGILHRDIAPDNIRVDDANRITLIDFGAAGARTARADSMESLPAVKDGYSPPEFYHTDAEQDFSSDFYSLGATYYHLITGDVPPSGDVRHTMISAGEADPYVPLCAGEWAFGYHLLSTIDLAMDLDRGCRIQSAEQWLKSLDEVPHVRPAPHVVQAADPDLDAIVWRIVMETNKGMDEDRMSQPSDKVSAKAKKLAAAGPAKKVWSDLSGNQFDDPLAWLKEQDREQQRREQQKREIKVEEPVAVAELPPPPEPVVVLQAPKAPPPPPQRKSLIGGLLSRYVTRRQETCVA